MTFKKITTDNSVGDKTKDNNSLNEYIPKDTTTETASIPKKKQNRKIFTKERKIH